MITLKFIWTVVSLIIQYIYVLCQILLTPLEPLILIWNTTFNFKDSIYGVQCFENVKSYCWNNPYRSSQKLRIGVNTTDGLIIIL